MKKEKKQEVSPPASLRAYLNSHVSRKYLYFERKPRISEEKYLDIPTSCKGLAAEIQIFYETSGNFCFTSAVGIEIGSE